MAIFGPGLLLDPDTQRPIAGSIVQVLDPITGDPIPTTETVRTNSRGYYGQFETLEAAVEHVKLVVGPFELHVPAVGAVLGLDSADIEAMQATLDDYQAGNAATDVAMRDTVNNDASLTRGVLDSTYGAREATVEVTVGTLGQYATIADALAALSRRRPAFVNGGLTANVRLLSGFVWAEQVRNYRQDLSWVTIVSDDAVVTIQRSALTTKYHRWYPAFLISDGASGPTLGCQLNMDATGIATERVGGYVRNASTLVVNENCGVTGAAVRGIDVASSSTLHAQVTNWSGAGEIGVRISNGSRAQLTQSTVTGCGTANLSVGGSCNVNATQCILTGSLSRGIDMSGNSILNADSADVSNAATEGVYLHGGAAQFTSGKANNCGAYGVRSSGAAVIHAGREGTTFLACDVSGSAGGFLAEYGGVINAEGALANNCTADAVKAQHGGKIVMPSGQANDTTGRAFVADHGSELSINLASGQRATGVGLDAHKGSTVHAQNVNVSGSLATIGCRAQDGSRIYFRNGNAQRGASPASGDITVTAGSFITAPGATGGISQTANTLTVNGAIFQ